MLKKTSDYQPLRPVNSTPNLLSSETDMDNSTKSQKPTNKEFRNFWVKTLIWEMRWDSLKKILDCQLAKSVNFRMSLKLYATSMMSWRGSTLKMTMASRNSGQKLSPRLLWWVKRSRDWMVLSVRKMKKSDHLVDRFKKSRKISVFLLNKLAD